MLKKIFLPAILFLLIGLSGSLSAQRGPQGKDFGFGIIVGDPLGGTIKYWFNSQNALDADIGGSYFGSPRIDVDYLWHFDAFQSRIVKLYAGAGGALGFGRGNGFLYKDKGRFYEREGNNLGIGIRGLFGLNVIPNRTPLEIFLQFGVLVGLAPETGSAVDLAIGLRFYP
ncbi:MAG: hypothetical protein ACM34K_03465 [Bacillota bacterium]